MYSGVTNSSPSAATIALFSADTLCGVPSCASMSASYKGIPCSVQTSRSALDATADCAERNSAVLNEPLRRLPEIPTSLTIFYPDSDRRLISAALTLLRLTIAGQIKQQHFGILSVVNV